ncbi:MAG: hypothetical protein BMS9Abin28_1794 [Anaerolineae bacterium]|nr:MAG: hypothetical protein BMS9Abin28_1794 [Anaerolineae bacterium]
MLSYSLFPEGLQLGSGVELGGGEGVQVDVDGGALVAVGGGRVGGGAVGGGRVAVDVREAVGVRVGVGVVECVGEGVGVRDGVALAVPVSVGVAVRVGVALSVAVSDGEAVGVTVLGRGEESCARGAAVTVSGGRNVGSGVTDGGGIGLGGVGSIAAAIRANTSELTGGKRAAVVEA